jgi:hypothetical protein
VGKLSEYVHALSRAEPHETRHLREVLDEN